MSISDPLADGNLESLVQTDDGEDNSVFGDPFDTAAEFYETIQNGLMVWRHAGQNPYRYKNAKILAVVEGHN